MLFVKLKLVVPLLIALIMLLSSLYIIPQGNLHEGSGNSSSPSNSPGILYNVTFAAHGLTNLFPGSDSWSLYLGNSTGLTPLYPTSDVYSTLVAAGTYYYQASDSFQQLFPYSGGISPNFTVSSSMTVNVNFSTPRSITFNEVGLSSNYVWGVNLSSSPYGLGTSVYTANRTANGNSTVTYYAIADTFQYSWYDIQNGVYYNLGNSGIVTNQQNMAVSLSVNHVSIANFTENNLPPGTTWYLNQISGPVMNNSYAQSSGTTISFAEENGMNTFRAGYILNGERIPLSSVTLDFGSVSSAVVNFPTLSTVNFTAGNLPAIGDYYGWGVNLHFSYGIFTNTVQSNLSTSDNLKLLLPMSSYLVTPFVELTSATGGTSPYYYADYNQFGMQVTGPGHNQAIYLSTLHKVTIDFLNFPAGGNYLTVASYAGNVSAYASYEIYSTQVVTFLAPEGRYNFTYGIGEHVIESNIPFNFTVKDASLYLNVTLNEVNFTAAYDPNGFTVHVSTFDFAQYLFGVNAPLTGESITAYLVNGTYSYKSYTANVGPSNLYETNEGNFTVNGASLTLGQNYPVPDNNVTIHSLGLSGSATYMVYVESLNQSVSSAFEGTIDMNAYLWLPSGAYEAYGATSTYAGNHYVSNNTYFNVTSGGPNSFGLDFNRNAYLKLVESGLPIGTSWSVSLNGTLYTTNAASMTITIVNDRQSNYIVNSAGNYYPTPSTGNIFPGNYFSYYGEGNHSFILPVTFVPLLLGTSKVPVQTLNISSTALGTGSNFNLGFNATASFIVSDPLNDRTYISYYSYAGSQMSGIGVFNSSSYHLIANVPLMASAEPTYSIVDTTSGMLYTAFSINVGGTSMNYISSLNLATDTIKVTPENIQGLYNIALDTQNGMIYAGGLAAIYELNPSSLRIVATIPMNDTYYLDTFISQITGLVYSSQTGLMYATGYVPDSVAVINPVTNAVVGNYSLDLNLNSQNIDYYTGGSTLDQKSGVLYFTVQGYNYSNQAATTLLAGFNINTNAFTRSIDLGSGFACFIAIDPYNGNIYIPLQLYGDPNSPLSGLSLGQLDVYDPSTGVLLYESELSQYPEQASVNPANGNIMVTTAGTDSITIFSAGVYGYINGTVNNKDANVTVDGITVPVIDGHFSAGAIPGVYYISAYSNGYAPVATSVDVTALSYSSVQLNFSRAETTYLVHGHVSPGTASVNFNGISSTINSTGYYEIYLPAGQYTESAYLSGYFPLSQNVNIAGNSEINLTLQKEPAPTAVLSGNNVTFQGFNVSGSDLALGNGSISLNFSSTGNGVLVLEVPYQDLGNVNISDILHSRIYINGTAYTDFTVTISSNYTIILKVMGLKSDPHLVWAFSPSVVVPSPANKYPLWEYAAIAALIVVIVAAISVVVIRRKKKS